MASHRIVIVGGGAGGLELAIQLGDKLGRRGRASVTLVERHRAHVGSPSCTRSPRAATPMNSTTSRSRTGITSSTASAR